MPKTLTPDDVAHFRDRLCDVAEHLFAVHGAEAVTIRQMAAALGVSTMTPYRYFKDKDAILAAVRARAFDRHAEALEKARAAPARNSIERSNAIGAAYVQFALENPEAYKLMFDVRQPNEAEYPDFVRAAERSHATMTAHLRDLAAEGLFDGDAEYVGHLYWAALHGPIMLQLSGLLEAPLDAPTLIAGLTRVLAQAHFKHPVST
ncbi:MAG TPA: TetR/AcrR family transcriptional regulator [Caulobacteraceae bacterium]